MMEEKDILNKEPNVYTELLYGTFNYFQDHPIMLAGVGASIGISIVSTCFIMSACLIIEKRNSKGAN